MVSYCGWNRRAIVVVIFFTTVHRWDDLTTKNVN